MDMEKVFICSAFRGDVEENIRKAREYCRWAAMECGAIPIAPPHVLPQFLVFKDPGEMVMGIEMGLELLAGCRRLFYFGDVTEGIAKEIARARELGIPAEHVPEEAYTINSMKMEGMV